MKKLFLFYTLCLLLVSCQSVNWITISVQKPAEFKFPLSVDNIVVVNNSALQPANIGHKKTSYLKEKSVEISSDSLNSVLTEALAQFMNDEHFFSQVISYDQNLREDAPFLSEALIDSSTIHKIAKETQAYALISVDRLVLESENRASSIGNSLDSEDLCVKMDVKFRLYLVSDPSNSILISYKDSLCWQAISQNGYYLTSSLPSPKQALRYAVLDVADKMVAKFIPYWKDQDRFYFSMPLPKMKEAERAFRKANWKKAALIMGDLYEKEKKTAKKAKLALNIALANEMLDDVENALNWATISADLFEEEQEKNIKNLSLVNLYKKELQQRLADFKILDIQVGNVQ